jgi:hypothetical protein
MIDTAKRVVDMGAHPFFQNFNNAESSPYIKLIAIVAMRKKLSKAVVTKVRNLLLRRVIPLSTWCAAVVERALGKAVQITGVGTRAI